MCVCKILYWAVSTAGMDYTSLITTLTFDNSNELQEVLIEILDDTICEGHESFSVFLSTSSDGCSISEPQLYVIIWDDEVHFGDDPHFSIALPGGKLLCYTVQGEHGFSFNLINNKNLVMNSKFVPDARRSEVTWLGSMGIIVKDSKYKGVNSTSLRFDSSDKSIHIGDKVTLKAKNIEKLTFADGKLTISEAPPATGFRYPSVMVDLRDVEISFTIKFTNQHLDMYWHSTGKKITDSHGLIGKLAKQKALYITAQCHSHSCVTIMSSWQNCICMDLFVSDPINEINLSYFLCICDDLNTLS